MLAAVDGGDGYWHPHPDDDPLTMLTGEFLPLLASRGLRTDRVAVAGWSMGGYGALLCALTRPELFRAVVATSPAIFRSYADARAVNPGAYDSAGEWDRYDVVARVREFAGLPLRVAIGAARPVHPRGARLAGPAATRRWYGSPPAVTTAGSGPRSRRSRSARSAPRWPTDRARAGPRRGSARSAGQVRRPLLHGRRPAHPAPRAA
ncbi:alpha/beta hydrolase-fold protein [Micromonospora sp. 4G55]|uniref:alpha/beta hydrolase-fold protein n=1 Tax=Micromonospora sp. 4G55 TaxID=2806102 RepID=UPI001EE4BA47|nr:alpha/beta hydrolase-fold protein [Micromonospora sp. 4G55]